MGEILIMITMKKGTQRDANTARWL